MLEPGPLGQLHAGLAHELAGLTGPNGAFVSDGFGVVHRKQASVYDVALDLPAYAALKYRGWEWEAELRDGGFRRAYMRTWPRSLAEVTEFDSHEEALAFQAWADGFSCTYSDQVFRVDGVEGSSGLRILYSSGRVQERVSFVRGSRRFAVSVNTMGPPNDHGAVEALARLADDFAR